VKPAETLTLAAGRTLCFARYGAADGRPVFIKGIVAAMVAVPR
jgi:hypothetical protein